MSINDVRVETQDTPTLETQKTSDGVGPLYHRIYSIVVESTWENALRAMRRLQQNLNHFSPQIMCRFEKTCGQQHRLEVGDEFKIHITGPWNGPVRVKSVGASSFALVTLEGHMEAGEIHFRVVRVDASRVRFEIESVAKSKDSIVDFVYDKLPIAKYAQTEMWKSVCETFAEELSFGVQGEPRGRIEDVKVVTERRNEETGEWQIL